MPCLSLVIPCYNEEEAVPELYAEAVQIFASLEKAFEIIFVDDGSKDETLNAVKDISAKDERIKYISFSRNFGKEAAIFAGLKHAKGDYIAVMDADGQDPLSLISQMLDAVSSGEYDCAACRRVNRRGEPPVRSLFTKCFYSFMGKISDVEVVSGARDFRLMSRKYLEALLSLPESNRFSKGIYPWLGFKVKWFEYENIKRKKGKTKFSFWSLLLYSLDGIIAFSSKPLAVASIIGILLFIASIAVIIFIIIRKFVWGDPVSGWASTICIILFCSGIQLFTVGILGQYVAKIYTEVKHRPHYIIREANLDFPRKEKEC